jgi:hypothetical protein
MTIRSPTANGLCGRAFDGERACVDLIFYPDSLGVGERWAILAAEQGGAEAGAWAVMAGREVPTGADASEVLDDIEHTDWD